MENNKENPKTCEEYILEELYTTKNDLFILIELIEENRRLKEQLKEKKEEKTSEDNMKCIYLSDEPYYWYTYNIQGTYNWNKILKDNNKKPDLIEKALTDEKKLEQLCKLKEKDSLRSELAHIDERVYNYLFKGRNNVYSVIETRKDSSNMYDITDSNRHFLKKEDAEKQFKEDMRKEIKYYLEHYKEKFYEEK